MKKILMLCGILVCCLTFLTSCDYFSHKEPPVNIDSLVTAKVTAAVNPQFSSMYEIVEFRDSKIEEYSIENTFLSMPDEVLTNVSTVCMRKSLKVTMWDIVNEYKKNKDVYDNLPSKAETQDKKDTTAVQGSAGGIAYSSNGDSIQKRSVTININ
jgi:hypothetical protein